MVLLMQASQLESTNRLLSTLVRLEKRLRAAESEQAIRFIAVNDSLGLVSFEQGVIGSARSGVILLSGLSEPDLNAPYVSWINKLLKYLGKKASPQFLSAADLPDSFSSGWQEWLPANLAALPLSKGEWLLLARPSVFSEGEQALLKEWSELLGFHLQTKMRRTIRLPLGLAILRSPLSWLLGFVIASSFIKVPLTVLAPAEIVAQSPALIRAPIDGVIAEVLVEPNQFVESGDLLFSFDDRALQNQLSLAQKRINTAQAAYRQSAQQALFDAESKNRLVLLQADIEEAELEVGHLNDQLVRAQIRAPLAGQILMHSQQEWLGRPVNLGERMVTLADPQQIELKGWLSPNDQVPLESGAKLTLFDNSRPDVKLAGELISVGFQVEERSDGSFAFPIKARLIDAPYIPPIGSRGTVRLESDPVSLAYLIIRRPLALVRQWLGV